MAAWGPMGHWSIGPASFSKNVAKLSSSSNSKLAMSLYADNDNDDKS